ncbi:MAG: hypothetical protein ACOYKN_20600, partial [Pirellula sp.]
NAEVNYVGFYSYTPFRARTFTINTVQNPKLIAAGGLNPLPTRQLNGSILNARRWFKTRGLKISSRR